jgi:hypothetical protein
MKNVNFLETQYKFLNLLRDQEVSLEMKKTGFHAHLFLIEAVQGGCKWCWQS